MNECENMMKNIVFTTISNSGNNIVIDLDAMKLKSGHVIFETRNGLLYRLRPNEISQCLKAIDAGIANVNM